MSDRVLPELARRAARRGGLRAFLAERLHAAASTPAARQGAWTVLDQALFSGSNFVVNVMLARWLAPEAFGAFTTAFIVFLVCGTVHAGLLVEPMLVFGPSRFERQRRAYLRRLVGAHGAFSAAFGAAAGVAWALGDALVAGVLAALALAQGGILLLWLARRACLVARRPALAAAGGAAYLVAVVGGALALRAAGGLSAATALLLMGAGAAGAARPCWRGSACRGGTRRPARRGCAPRSARRTGRTAGGRCRRACSSGS